MKRYLPWGIILAGAERPLIYDLCCKAGGASAGYYLAGFRVIGVDKEPQKRYPFQFIKMDVIEFLTRYLAGEFERAAAFHASPPCQGYSALRYLPWLQNKSYPMLIDPIRDLLQETQKPWIIENVERAPLVGIVLCGVMFGLPIYRHRKFETSFFVLQPPHQKHKEIIGHGRNINDRKKGSLNNSSAAGAWGKQKIITVAGNQFRKEEGALAMQINWMTKPELAQAIPPAYTEFIGQQLFTTLQNTGVL
jgi:DNA (cytosine-5)-methyltransferase 1